MRGDWDDDRGVLEAFGVRRNADPFTWTLQYFNGNDGGVLQNPTILNLFKVPESYPLIITKISHQSLAVRQFCWARVKMLRNNALHTVQKDHYAVSEPAGGTHDGTKVLAFNGFRPVFPSVFGAVAISTMQANDMNKFPAFYLYRPGDQVGCVIEYDAVLQPAVGNEVITLGGFILR